MQQIVHSDKPSLRKAFYEKLLGATFLLPTTAEPSRILPPGCPLIDDHGEETGFLATTDPEGKPALFIFTSESALTAWRPNDQHHVEMESGELFRFALANEINSIVINAGDASAGFLSRGEIQALADNLLPTQIDNGVAAQSLSESNKIAIKPLSTSPAKELINMICQQASEHDSIEAVYLAEGTIGNDRSRLIVALQLTVGSSADKVMSAIAKPIQSALPDGEYIDFLPFSPLSSLAQSLSQQIEPTFQKTT